MTEEKKEGAEIKIRIKRIKQLFNSLDPSPFIEKDLDDDASDYIVSSANEIDEKKCARIVIHIPKSQKGKFSEDEVMYAIYNFFSYKKTFEDLHIKQRIKRGQKTIIIGISFLATCLLLRELIIITSTDMIFSAAARIFMNILTEMLLICGWVAMWNPINVILYEWWPLKKQSKIYRRITEMKIGFVYE